MGWDGMEWNGMGWDGMGWMGWGIALMSGGVHGACGVFFVLQPHELFEF